MNFPFFVAIWLPKSWAAQMPIKLGSWLEVGVLLLAVLAASVGLGLALRKGSTAHKILAAGVVGIGFAFAYTVGIEFSIRSSGYIPPF